MEKRERGRGLIALFVIGRAKKIFQLFISYEIEGMKFDDLLKRDDKRECA